MAAGTRDKMVHSAAVLLRQRGVRGTSFARVLEHSGAPRGSISHHFPGGKNEMIQAAVSVAGQEISVRLQDAADHGASAADLVNAVCDYFGDGLDRTDYRAGCAIVAVANEAFDDETLRTSTEAAMRGWIAILSSTLRSDGHTRDTADELAELSVAAIEGAVMIARVQRSRRPIDTTRKHLATLLSRTRPVRGPVSIRR
jgi:TetR/AcrR family transcriptional repressor of lmrAB and yxaGH operons